jgi:hypothetical protein
MLRLNAYSWNAIADVAFPWQLQGSRNRGKATSANFNCEDQQGWVRSFSRLWFSLLCQQVTGRRVPLTGICDG